MPKLATAAVLMHMDLQPGQVDGSTTFVDEMGHAVTPVGNAQLDTAQSVFGGASYIGDGAGDYLTIATGADCAMGTGDFSAALRVRLAATTINGSLVGNRRNAGGSAAEWYLGFQATNNCLSVHSGGGIIFDNTTNPLVNNTWHLVTVCRASGTLYFGIDGTIISSHAFANDLTATTNFSVGGFDVFATNSINGWIDELLMIKGLALYTANFTVPDLPYYLKGALPLFKRPTRYFKRRF
jgi:hypothetical protein